MLLQVSLPILSFSIWENSLSKNIPLINPLSLKTGQVLGISIKNQDNFPSFISTAARLVKPNFSQMQISVPALNINQETIIVDSNDLSLGLAHLPGSALPGERGNVFISGHSSLPIFSKSKKAIFATLDQLKKYDTILVNGGGVNYQYKVIDIKIIKPTDLSVINPLDSKGRYITLMTCVPPGLNIKRLVVIGELI